MRTIHTINPTLKNIYSAYFFYVKVILRLLKTKIFKQKISCALSFSWKILKSYYHILKKKKNLILQTQKDQWDLPHNLSSFFLSN